MKKFFGLLLLLLVLTPLLYVLVNLAKTNSYSLPKVLPNIDQEIVSFLPVRLIIPVLNINTNIQSLGTNLKGEMEVPSNITDVGLYKFGAVPGQIGSAVMAGHLNGENNQKGVFADLDKLKTGDKMFVEDKMGKSITFVVWKKKLYNSGYAEDVFNQNSDAHLNLITCDGFWNETKQDYTKRLVIFSDILKE